MRTLELFHIGEDYYFKSSTIMSPIYEAKTHERYDWGSVQLALSNGFTITIRPANAEEKEWADKRLKEVSW